MGKIDVQKLKDKKNKLEFNIKKVLNTFTQETGLKVDSIQVSLTSECRLESPYSYYVHTSVSL